MTNVATIDPLDALGLDRVVIVHKMPTARTIARRWTASGSNGPRLREVGIADYVGFQALLKLMQETDHAWAKIRAHTGFRPGPPYHEITSLARRGSKPGRSGLLGGRVGGIQFCGIILCRTMRIV